MSRSPPISRVPALFVAHANCCMRIRTPVDAYLLVADLDSCMNVANDMIHNNLTLNRVRSRKLIHALCLARRPDDAFLIFEHAPEGDPVIYNDLIDLAMECHCPQRVLPVHASMIRLNETRCLRYALGPLPVHAWRRRTDARHGQQASRAARLPANTHTGLPFGAT